MAECIRTRRIDSSPGEVWATLADLGAISSWAPNCEHSSLLTEGNGTGVGAVRRVQAGRTTLLERVVEWEPEGVLAYQLEGLPSVIRSAVMEWRLRLEADATIVTLTSRVDAGPRPPQRLIANIAARRLAKASDQMLDGLATRHQVQETP